MKHIQTFESFLNEKLNEAYGPNILDNRGTFDDEAMDYTWEAAATWAFGKSLGLKNQKEIDDTWNSQLDDRKSDLNKAMSGTYDKGINDITRAIRDVGATPQSIRDGIKQMGDRLATLSGVFAGADKAPVFIKLQKDALAYADKLEKETPLEPIKIVILPGEVIKTKGIKAKEYYEAGYVECSYKVVVVFKDGRAMQGSVMYASENEVGTNSTRMNGNDLAKQKEFLKRYEKAVDSADPSITSYKTMGSVNLTVLDITDLKKADAIIKSKVIPSLKKEFKNIEVNF
jgi:hypothetical protein